LINRTSSEAIVLNINELLSLFKEQYLQQVAGRVLDIISSGHNCVIQSCQDPTLRFELAHIAESHKLTQVELAESVRDSLASIVYIVLDKKPLLGGVILCGGDIAVATANKLDAHTYRIKGMVADCVPWGALNSPLTPFPVFTKAGGFGVEDTFLKVIQHIKKEVK